MSKHGDNRNIRVLQFLEAYEKQECLWNPVLESYKNKAARDEAYMQIIRDLNAPNLTIHDIKLKVKSIRTTYTKELRLLTKHKEESKPYSPKLFWFNRANCFLKNVSLSRDKRANLSEKANPSSDSYKQCAMDYISDIPQREGFTDEHTDTVLSNEDPCNTSSSTFEYKADIETEIQEDMNIVEEQADEGSAMKVTIHGEEGFAQEVSIVNTKAHTANATDVPNNSSNHLATNNPAPNINSTCDDEYDLFCRSVAAQLRSISDTYSRSVAKLKIQQILFEAETGHYRNNPCITIPVSQHIGSNI